MERQLATIKTIRKVKTIEGADAIVAVKFNECFWVCVMKKEEAVVGRKVVFFEIDSLLPKEDDRFAFMAPKFRVKTIKLRGQISQGLALPLEMFPELGDLDEFTDVTDTLKIDKWELQEAVKLQGNAAGNFPGYFPKTDEPRLQNYREKDLVRLLGTELTATLKIDGTSGTFYKMDEHFGVCSRNLELKDEGDNVYWKIAKQYDLEKVLTDNNENLVLQGEIAGPGIQKNRAKFEKVDLYIFNIRYIDTGERLTYEAMVEKLKELSPDLQPVPFVEKIEANRFKTFEDVEAYVENHPLNDRRKIEGFVFRNKEGDSFKVINKNYLLANDA